MRKTSKSAKMVSGGLVTGVGEAKSTEFKWNGGIMKKAEQKLKKSIKGANNFYNGF
jgi:hypothetical protein